MEKDLPLVEAHVVTDIFVAGLAEVEDLGGGVLRFTFYTRQTNVYSKETERVVVARIVMTEVAALNGVAKTFAAMGKPVIVETIGNGNNRHH